MRPKPSSDPGRPCRHEPATAPVDIDLSGFVDTHAVGLICQLLLGGDAHDVALAPARLFALSCSEQVPDDIVRLARQLYAQLAPLPVETGIAEHLIAAMAVSGAGRH